MDLFFSEYLLNLRKKSNLTQSEFASFLGVSPMTISSIENGRSSFPNKKLLENISKFNKESIYKTIRDIIFYCEKNISKHNLITLYSAWYTTYGNTIYYYLFDNKNLCDSVIAYKKNNPSYFTLYIEIDKLLFKNKNIDIVSLYYELMNIYKYYTENIPGLISRKANYSNRKPDIRNAHFVLDSNNKEHVQLFNMISKQKCLSIIKFDVSLNLFDINKFKITRSLKIS